MKKAIFLVEDIKDGVVYTLLEAVYDKLNKKLVSEGRGPLNWLSEITTLLNNHPSDFITFQKASEFIKNNSIPEDKDVFYFISCYHSIDVFTTTNFLLMDPEVSDFLVKHNIPVILDASMEIGSHHSSSFRILENGFFSSNNMHTTHRVEHYRNLSKLDFYVVGSMYSVIEDYVKQSNRLVNTYHAVFPGPFFQYNARGLHFNQDIISNRDTRLETVNNRIITEDTLVWQAYSNKTRLNRGLFLLKAEYEGLGRVGRYSRLLPGREDFEHECKVTSINKFKDRTPYMSEKSLKTLDDIKVINATQSGVNCDNDFKFLVWVSLETFAPHHESNILHSSSFLTEKTAMAIGSAAPFIPVGGHRIGEQLTQAGFRNYEKLEFPTQPNLLDELDYVVDRLKEISSMSLEQKQELYNSWKETIAYNYDRYLNINIKKYYLEILNKSRRQAKGAS